MVRASSGCTGGLPGGGICVAEPGERGRQLDGARLRHRRMRGVGEWFIGQHQDAWGGGARGGWIGG